MKRLLFPLRSCRGESLVEVMVSMVLFLLIMGVLSGAMRFAASAQSRAEDIKTNAETVQQNLRSGTDTRQTLEGTQTFSFRAISKDESQWSTNVMFSVTVQQWELEVEGESQDAIFHQFRREGGGP